MDQGTLTGTRDRTREQGSGSGTLETGPGNSRDTVGRGGGMAPGVSPLCPTHTPSVAGDTNGTLGTAGGH